MVICYETYIISCAFLEFLIRFNWHRYVNYVHHVYDSKCIRPCISNDVIKWSLFLCSAIIWASKVALFVFFFVLFSQLRYHHRVMVAMSPPHWWAISLTCLGKNITSCYTTKVHFVCPIFIFKLLCKDWPQMVHVTSNTLSMKITQIWAVLLHFFRGTCKIMDLQLLA